jgi:two-component system, NtrC family, nitrogen regulation response regulator NtrX
MSKRILIVDDEPDIRQIVGEILEDEGYTVEYAKNAAEARECRLEFNPELILLDIWMPNEDGIELLKSWHKSQQVSCPIIMISGHGNVETAVETLKFGAQDFLEKPLSTAKLLITVERTLQSESLKKENLKLRGQLLLGTEIIGDSAPLTELKRQIRLLGPTDGAVFITGEPGSGKSTVAHAIHANSHRRNSQLVEVSLAAIPPETLALQLFGYEKGDVTTPGFFEQAHGGTLLLDELLDLDMDTQAKLISALQESSYIRVGGNTQLPLDVRVISTTSQDLDVAIAEGRLREDLLYRVNVLPIYVPPLRDSPNDIELFAQHFMALTANRENLPLRNYEPDAIKWLKQHDWPGNLRELANLTFRLLVLNRGESISADETKLALGKTLTRSDNDGLFSECLELDIRHARDLFEEAYLRHHLIEVGGNVGKLAEVVGMERTHLYRKLKALGIDPKSGKS